MSEEIIKHLGPLAPLAGKRKGDSGIDTSRIHSRETVKKISRRSIIYTDRSRS